MPRSACRFIKCVVQHQKLKEICESNSKAINPKPQRVTPRTIEETVGLELFEIRWTPVSNKRKWIYPNSNKLHKKVSLSD